MATRAVRIEHFTQYTGSNGQEIVDSNVYSPAEPYEWSEKDNVLTIDTRDYAGVLTVPAGAWVSDVLNVVTEDDFNANYYRPDGTP